MTFRDPMKITGNMAENPKNGKKIFYAKYVMWALKITGKVCRLRMYKKFKDPEIWSENGKECLHIKIFGWVRLADLG